MIASVENGTSCGAREPTRLLRRALLLVVATLAALLAAELGVHALRRSALVPGLSPFVVVPDDVLGWRYPGGVSVRHRSSEFDVVCRFDDRGHRIAERASARPVAVFVGDSLTFGWGVRAEDAFPFVLGRELGLSVANLGVAGYGTGQSYLALLSEGLPLRPVLVVFTSCANDYAEVARGHAYGRTKPLFRLDESGRLHLDLPRHRRPWIESHSELWRAARSRMERGRNPLSEGERASAAAVIARLVREMAVASARGGAYFVVAHDAEPWVDAALAGVPGACSVDLGPLFARSEEPLVFARDHHWNPLGHRVVADAIARRLIAAGWEPPMATAGSAAGGSSGAPETAPAAHPPAVPGPEGAPTRGKASAQG